jgi:hypothetical protein
MKLISTNFQYMMLLKNIIKLISIVLFLFLISCNSGLDQTKLDSVEQENIGKYFYNVFKEGDKEEFKKWIYKPENVERFWNIVQNYKGEPISWNTTEYNYSELSDYPSNHMRLFMNLTDRGNRPVIIFYLDKELDNKFYLGLPTVRTRSK